MSKPLREFYYFLKKYHALDDYFRELVRCQGRYSPLYFQRAILSIPPERYIIGPINWVDSPIGPRYWSLLNQVWLKHLSNLKSNR